MNSEFRTLNSEEWLKIIARNTSVIERLRTDLWFMFTIGVGMALWALLG